MRPISPERCIGARDLTEPRLSPDGTMLVYAVGVAGSAALSLSMLDGTALRQLTSYPQLRAGRGLGGGGWCWLPDSTGVVFAAADGNLWLQPVPGGQVRRLTDNGPDRSAQAPAVSPDGGHVVYVIDQLSVWMQPVSGGVARRLDDGSADFCFDPVVSPDGTQVTWQAWNVPDMAWDHSRLQHCVLASGELHNDVPPGAVQQPGMLADGTRVCVRDDTGWNIVWLGDGPLVDEPFEHADPTWGLGQRTYAVSPDGREIAFTRNESGFGRLCVVDIESRQVREVARAVHGQLSWRGARLAALRTGARTPTQVVVYDTATWERTVVDVGPMSGWEREPLAEPELVEVSARDGATLFARLYRADGDAGSQRLLCWLHGGPTDQWQVTFNVRIAFWRSHGWNVLVPDHRGSSGHGREYQQAMRHRWGDLDVSDTIDAVAHAHAQGWGSPLRTVLMGGSAGGFTALGAAAAAPDLLAAAVVSYPVTDLFDLGERSHRFERHYTDSLVGPIPPGNPSSGPYHDRSPVNFASAIRAPLLVFHGDADPVVPVEQSRELATKIVEAGGSVVLTVYEGEGHGFRQPAHQLDEYRRIAAFFAEYVG